MIATSQDKQNELIQELEKIKTIVKQILVDVSQQVNHQINQNLLNMPLNYEVITREWKNILTKITQPAQKSNEENFGKNYSQISKSILRNLGKFGFRTFVWKIVHSVKLSQFLNIRDRMNVLYYTHYVSQATIMGLVEID